MTEQQKLAVMIMFDDLDMSADQIANSFAEQRVRIPFSEILSAITFTEKTIERANGNTFLEYDNQVRTLAEWSRITGIQRQTIKRRIDDLGWSVEKALTTGCKVQNNNRSTYTARDTVCLRLH